MSKDKVFNEIKELYDYGFVFEYSSIKENSEDRIIILKESRVIDYNSVLELFKKRTSILEDTDGEDTEEILDNSFELLYNGVILLGSKEGDNGEGLRVFITEEGKLYSREDAPCNNVFSKTLEEYVNKGYTVEYKNY